jgi:DNA-binding CsgD family transcriptional regulator
MNRVSPASSPVIHMDYPSKFAQPTEMFLDDPELERLVLRLHGCSDLAELWSATCAILGALAPNDASLMYVSFHNFARSWDAARVFVTPKTNKSVGWIQRRGAVDITSPYILDHPDLPMFRLSDVCRDPRELQNAEFFRWYMEPDGWHHSACLLFWQGARLHSQITLWRSEAQGDFTAKEMALLGRLHPHLGTALNRLVNATLSTIKPRALELGGDLIRGLESVPHKSGAAGEPDCPLPEAPRALCETGRKRHQEDSERTRVAFSDKERAALQLAASGVSNQEISKRLGVSIHTVKWYLANVYTKLGVRNRTAAVKAALAIDLA